MAKSISNKTAGNRFEQELCDRLKEYGFWSHNMAQTEVGQPADIIAVKNDWAILIDCKLCQKDYFPLSRIEPNQEAAMTYWKSCKNSTAWFAIKVKGNDTIYILIWETAKKCLDCGLSSIIPSIECHTLEWMLNRPERKQT